MFLHVGFLTFLSRHSIIQTNHDLFKISSNSYRTGYNENYKNINGNA